MLQKSWKTHLDAAAVINIFNHNLYREQIRLLLYFAQKPKICED
jgi:hypothetical protein